MEFDLNDAMAVLARTPETLRALLNGLPAEWLHKNEGPDTWSPYDVVGHLIHGERTDWIPRVKIILKYGESRTFEPFDRFAQFKASQGKTIEDLLEEFASLRAQNLAELRGLGLDFSDLQRTGRHPEFDKVTLRQMLATWVVHDLDHLRQIVRTMARQYAHEVGPWQAYLKILDGSPGGI